MTRTAMADDDCGNDNIDSSNRISNTTTAATMKAYITIN